MHNNTTSPYYAAAAAADDGVDAFRACIYANTDFDGDVDPNTGLHSYDTLGFVGCLSEEQMKTTVRLTRSLFLIFTAALVFFMQAGFAMVCAGTSR